MADDIKPARGVDLAQVLPVTAVLLLAAVGVLALCVAYRRGRTPMLDRAVVWAERESGMPAWAAIPAMVSSLSLLTAGFGFYWDVAVHIDNGRDSSPFGTAAHWPILLGLCGLALAGVLAIALDKNTDGGASVTLPGGLRCSLGAVLVLLCGSVSLAGFPLDDIWHNLFGQDVTLWSPTHIQMIGGASLTTLATWVLIEEGKRRGTTVGSRHLLARLMRPSALTMSGAFLIGLSTLQDEFDMGVPQFNAIYHPILIAIAASIGLVAARLRIGRFGAIQAALVFCVLRGSWALIIGQGFDLTVPHMPIYLAEAVLVELVALVVSLRRQVLFGAVCGFAIGTVGMVAEWGWSQIAYKLPWEGALFPEAYVLALASAVAGGILGGIIGRSLLPQDAPRTPSPRAVPALAFATLLAVIGVALPFANASGSSAEVTVEALKDGTANLTVQLQPAALADDAAWFNVTSWQGGDLFDGRGLQLTSLDRIGPGLYRTQRPVPVTGDYKTVLRVATARTQMAVGVYLPEDKAIPAELVPASPRFTREFVQDQELLQREAIGGSPVLKQVAYIVLGLLALLWIGTLSLGLRRLDRSAAAPVAPLGILVPA